MVDLDRALLIRDLVNMKLSNAYITSVHTYNLILTKVGQF